MKIISQKIIEDRFFNFFPPPAFLNIKTTSVDISDSSVKVLSLEQTQYGNIPVFFDEQKISKGIVHQGNIIDPKALSAVLSTLREKHGMDFVRASLPEEKVYLFQTTIPNSKDDEQIFNSVEFQLEEHVPIPPSESVFDYDIIRERNNTIDVSVTVFPKSVIANYQKVFESAGLTLVSFALEGQAIANSVVADEDTKTYMIVDFGETRSGIFIVKNGVVSFTSTVDVSGDELTEAIMKYFKVDNIEAQNIRNKKGFINNKENKDLYNSLISTISALKDEINRHLIYWNTKDTNDKKEDKIHKVIFCGGGASLVGLLEFLSSGIEIPVEKADVWQNAFSYDNYVPSMNKNISLSYATVIGLELT